MKTTPHTTADDERRLHELGYAQELQRRMTAFSNFGVFFTIISVLSGCLTLYGFGMRTGGPAVIVWGWPVVGLPALWNLTAYGAVTSIAVIGLYIAYAVPTLLRLRRGDDFARGPWHLGRWSRPVGIVAVVWVGLVTVLFVLPQSSPISWETFNYAPVAVLAVLGFAGAWWLLSARHWFTGPQVQGTPEELAAIERELAPAR